MTEGTSEGQVRPELMTIATLGQTDGTSEPSALVPEGMPLVYPKPDDPLNAAIAATAGEPVAKSVAEEVGPTLEQRAAAMEAYIKAGVANAMAAMQGHEIVTTDGLRWALGELLRHLHLDHPENYLPKG